MLIVGAARQGTALARYLARAGARVILNDRQSAEALHANRAALADVSLTWELGGHPLTLLEGTDLVCVSGGVPLEIPLLVEARRRGIPLSNDSQIFLERVPCDVIGITGSAGKTTTTALVGRMGSLAEARKRSIQTRAGDRRPRRTWVGGNIGNPLIACLDEIQAQDLVVMELSSFQLELMNRAPAIATVLNLTPNHLDRHKTMEAYTAAKARILKHQTSRDIAVLNRDDRGSWALREHVRGRLVTFGRGEPDRGVPGTFLRQGAIWYRDGGGDLEVLPLDTLRLRGEHNRDNVLAACVLALEAGLPLEAIRAAVASFEGLPHRLEFVRQWGGAEWYNDSIATAPERAMAAIRAFDEPLILLAGGRDKDLPWEAFVELVRQRVDHVVVFGEAGPKIARALGPVQQDRRPYSITRCEGLQAAVEAAAQLVRPGYVVLLSPGGTSFDEFRDFEHRGETYKQWVMQVS